VANGVEKNIGQVFVKAIKQYVAESDEMIKELEAVKAKYANKR